MDIDLTIPASALSAAAIFGAGLFAHRWYIRSRTPAEKNAGDRKSVIWVWSY